MSKRLSILCDTFAIVKHSGFAGSLVSEKTHPRPSFLPEYHQPELFVPPLEAMATFLVERGICNVSGQNSESVVDFQQIADLENRSLFRFPLREPVMEEQARGMLLFFHGTRPEILRNLVSQGIWPVSTFKNKKGLN